MKFFLNFFVLALLVLPGMVSAQCATHCEPGGGKVCARDPGSTSGNGGYQEFRDLCEMLKTNCIAKRPFQFVRYGNCNA